MVKLPNIEFRHLVCTVNEDLEFYEDKEPRKILWPEYNLSQIEDARTTLDFIKENVDNASYLKIDGKVGRPLTDAKELVKCVLICEAFGFTERSAQGWLQILSPYLNIHSKLDDRTIGDAYDKREVLHILKQIFESTKKSDGKLCGDGTGLETSRKQNYETNKKAGDYMISIVDSRELCKHLI